MFKPYIHSRLMTGFGLVVRGTGFFCELASCFLAISSDPKYTPYRREHVINISKADHVMNTNNFLLNRITLPKLNSSPLKIGRNPKGKSASLKHHF